MYSVVLMAALTTAVDMPERGGRRGGGGCCGCYGGGGYGGGGCYGGWGGGYGGGWGGCYGGGMGMGWGGGCYGGGGGGYRMGGWGGGGWGYSGYALGNFNTGFGNYAYSPMGSNWGTPVVSNWGTPVVTAGGINQWMQYPNQGYLNLNGTSAITLGSQSNYFNPAGSNEATIVVHLPADALLKIEGQQMQSQSNTRVFTSPPLDTGKTYTYTLRAEVNRDGRKVSEEKSVDVRAGQSSEVNFTFEGATRNNDGSNESATGNREPQRRTLPVPPPDR